MEVENQFAVLAREKKCLAVAKYVLDECARIVAAQTDAEWTMLAKNAGQNSPSAESKAKIMELLKGARIG